MIGFDTQKELLRERVTPSKTLEKAIHIEMGIENQQHKNKNWTINPTVNIVTNFLHRDNNQQRQNWNHNWF